VTLIWRIRTCEERKKLNSMMTPSQVVGFDNVGESTSTLYAQQRFNHLHGEISRLFPPRPNSRSIRNFPFPLLVSVLLLSLSLSLSFTQSHSPQSHTPLHAPSPLLPLVSLAQSKRSKNFHHGFSQRRMGTSALL